MDKLVEIASDNGIWLAILGVIGLAIGVISFTIRFDYNKWQERRDNAKREKLRVLCPHTSLEFDLNRDTMSADSYFHSPMMSPYWICRRCGTQTLDSRAPQDILQHWVKHPLDWLELEKRFLKQARKLGFV